MTIYFISVMGLIVFMIIVVTVIGLNLNNSKYFSGTVKDQDPQIKFFIKKHTIFRYFSLLYALIHYFLNIVSIITSFITVYMVMAKLEIDTQILFLLTAAITTNLVIGLRVDKIAEAYAQAMRLLEYAILKFSLEDDSKAEILYEANDKAEQCIGNKFF